MLHELDYMLLSDGNGICLPCLTLCSLITKAERLFFITNPSLRFLVILHVAVHCAALWELYQWNNLQAHLLLGYMVLLF